MKIILFCLVWVQTFALIIEKPVQIDGKTYILVHESYSEYGDKGIEMKLYTKKANNDVKKYTQHFYLT